MSSQSKVKVIFGTAGIAKLPEPKAFYDVLESHHVTKLDTAHIYADSEATIGSTGGSQRFEIDTKAPGFRPGSLAADNVKAAMNQSLTQLKVDHVETYFLHAPDTQTPIEETLKVINELYVAGKFKRFGLSNYDAAGVQEIIDIANKNSWVKPSVYQGNYNPAARHIEKDIFPALRKHKIAFDAYSPLAGGFLVKSKEQLTGSNTSARWDPKEFTGKLYFGMYGKPTLLDALSQWEDTANAAGISKAALCYRWVAYHSALKGEYDDTMIVGASRLQQLEESLKAYEDGPLPESAVQGVEKFWEMVKDEAPTNNYESLQSLM